MLGGWMYMLPFVAQEPTIINTNLCIELRSDSATLRENNIEKSYISKQLDVFSLGRMRLSFSADH